MAQNNRLDLLKRRNAGDRLRPKLTAQLASTLGVAPERVSFLSIEESNALLERASRSFPPRDQIEGERGSYPFLSRSIQKPCSLLPLLPEVEGDVYLMLPEAYMVGVLRFPIRVLNAGWSNLLDLKPDGFRLVDTYFLNKAVIQTDITETNSEVLLNLAAWGQAWAKAIRNFQ